MTIYVCVKHLPTASFRKRRLNAPFWVTGLFNGFRGYEAVSHVSLFAAPDELTMGQVEKIAVKYMNDNPKRLNEPTAILVLAALIDAYPPKKK